MIRDLMPQRYVYTVAGSGLASDLMRVSVGVGEVSVIVRVAPRNKKSKTRKPRDNKKKRRDG